MHVTNNAGGARGFNIKTKRGQAEMVMLQPGETIENVELIDDDDKAFLGMVKSRELLIEKGAKVLKAAESAEVPQVEPVKPAADTREAVDPKKMDDEQRANTKQNKPAV